jgi:UDP-GlcNAc:undecaprenyl-phosphate/decaprenyl-phosphate GlcNAc-1-phosphate transferase
VNNAIPQLVFDYSQLVPFFLIALVIASVSTPLIGRLAVRFGALDLPGHLRSRLDRTAERRIHDRIVPKLGGLATAIAMIATLLLTDSLGQLRWGIIVGILIITVIGVLDDTYNLSARVQLGGQALAGLMVVLSGITVASIQVAGVFINLNLYSTDIELGSFIYHLIFPGDLITIVWIVGVINAINWVGGIDALNGSLSSVAAFTMLLIAMRTGNIPLAILIAIYLGGVLGVLPFNYNPAKIFFGTVGEFLNGFLLAVFAILGGSKLPLAIIILGLPIIDAIWVVFLRIKSNPDILKKPMKILTISDKNHLHHRLLSLGYSQKSVLFIELAIMAILCTIAFYFSGFRDEFVALVGAFALIISVFAVIGIGRKQMQRANARQAEIKAKEPKVEIKIVNPDDKNDEEKYAY